MDASPLIVLSKVITLRAKMGKYVRESDLAKMEVIIKSFGLEKMGTEQVIQVLVYLVSLAERNFDRTAMG